MQFLKENLAAAFNVEFNDEVMQMETMIVCSKVECPFISIMSTFENWSMYQACNVEFNDEVVCETITTVKNNAVNMDK